MTRIHLVRHAEPLVQGVFLGRSDPPLSEQGRKDAASKLTALDACMVYSSPLRRALETAEYVPHASPVVVLSDLAEIGFGEWEGFKWTEVEQRWPDVARRKQLDWFSITPPAGEEWSALVERVTRAWHVIRSGPLPCAVVAHAAVNSVLSGFLGRQAPGAFQQQYCEVISYDVEKFDS